VYVNPAFCRLSGYDVAELVGKNLRVLQGDDREQPELVLLRDALRHAEPVRSLLRNVRKDGTVFVNDMQIYPLKDSNGQVTHFIGYHRKVAAAPRPANRASVACPTGCARTASPAWPRATTSRTC
jgi:PAS domain S-box-containing protein